MAMSRLLIAAFAVVMPISCCRTFTTPQSEQDAAAHQWLKLPPNNWDNHKLERLDDQQIRVVSDAKTQAAESMLSESDAVPLSGPLAQELTAGWPSVIKAGGVPYLVRGVCTAPDWTCHREVNVTPGGDVWVGSGAISQCRVPMQRTPIVVWLAIPPRDVFVTFQLAR